MRDTKLQLKTIYKCPQIYLLLLFLSTRRHLIQLATSYLQPYLILPLFFEPQPLEAGSLRSKIENLAEKTAVKVDKIFTIDASRYSKHTNAFFTGWGREKRIYLFDTLLKKNSEAEIISILGHELGHSKLHHVPMGIALSTVSFFLTLLLLKLFYRMLEKDQSRLLLRFSAVSSLPLYSIILALISLITTPLLSGLSRYNEGQADQYALEITGDVKAYISTEKKLAIDNKSRLDPHPVYAWFNYSHPPALQRIKRGLEFASKNK